MYITLIVTFLLILAVVIPGIQNNTPVTLKFFFWEIEATLTALIFYSALLGAAIVAILILPKLARKYLDLRNLKKNLSVLQENAIEKDIDPV
ncbi:MAG: LapA family protein [Deltaproteobacteria bacterium]|nr:LapA family protein [Deltaproteobacteria bacterium]